MRADLSRNKKLLSSQARIQSPWIKVTIGGYTFGVFDSKTKNLGKNNAGFFTAYSVQYPQYIKSLSVKKINGQVNIYQLIIEYPITQFDDPNFFEKVFSSASRSRKIIFTYGDAEVPAYVYKNEEAIITGISQDFNLQSSAITYTVKAVSSASLATDGSITVPSPGKKMKPSDEIKKLFKTNKSLQKVFTGMSINDLEKLIPGDDQPVELQSKCNISAVDYINYLASCMIPIGSSGNLSNEIYILTIYDDSITNSDKALSQKGPYFKVSKVSTLMSREDAYEIDIGINTSTIVRSFNLNQQDNYSIYYEYQNLAHPENFVRRLNNSGQWEDVFAPTSMLKPGDFKVNASDQTWWTKATQFPINAEITVQGLLRPATLMQYVHLNIIFPGGNKHINSGLYIITKQVDTIREDGYTTTLSLTRIKGDADSI